MKIAFCRHSLLSRGGDKMFLFHANKLAEKGHEVWLFVNEVNTVFDVGRKQKWGQEERSIMRYL